MNVDVVTLAGRIKWLLEAVAETKRPCKFCGRTLYFVRVKSGKLSPLTGEAVNHFSDCPHFQRQHSPEQQSLLDTAPDPL